MNETTPTVDPKHTMLLVMDCQPAILINLPGADELLARLVEAIDVARSGGVRIGYVRLGFDDADYDAMPDTNKALTGVAASRRIHNEAPETAIHDLVQACPS